MRQYEQIRPSTFTSRISVLVPIVLSDAGGGIGTTGFEEQYATWGCVRRMSGTRAAQFGMDLFQKVWEVYLRYNEDRPMTTGQLIECNGQIMIVKSPDLIKENYKAFWYLICVEATTT